MNSKSVDLKGLEGMEDDNIVILSSDAGEPRKADICEVKDVKLSNNAKTTEGGSEESGRGDTAAGKKNLDKKREEYKAKDSAKCTINQINKSPIKSAEAYVNKIKLRPDNSNLQEAKYNKIMESINKIIQENIDLINSKAISSDPQREVATENKVSSENYLDKKDSRFKQPEKQHKKEDKALVKFSEKITHTKASNCTPLYVAKTVNDVKNKSLVIEIPKHTSGCKLREKPKMCTDLNKNIPESSQAKLSSFQQRNARQTTENCAIIKRQTRDILINKSNSYWATKIQTDPKDHNKKPKTLTKTESQAETFESYDIYTKKPVLRNNKVKKKHAIKNKSATRGSRTKLPMPTVVDEHSKLYYGAWINNTAIVSAQEQLLEDTILQRLPSEPVEIPEMTPEDCTDKRFTGIIKVKYGKKLK